MHQLVHSFQMLQWLPIALRTKPRFLALVHTPCGNWSAFWFIPLHSLLHSSCSKHMPSFCTWNFPILLPFQRWCTCCFFCLPIAQTFMSLPPYHSAFNANVSTSAFLSQPLYLETAPPSLFVILPYLTDFRIIEIIFQCICLYIHCFISPDLSKI